MAENGNNSKPAPSDRLEKWQIYGFVILGIVCAAQGLFMIHAIFSESIPRVMEELEARQKEREGKPE